jgi:hypothetical protein
MKESEAANEIMSIGTTVVRSWPTATVIEKLAIVAKKTAKSTLKALYRVAKDMAKNWVLSPISAKTISTKEAAKAAKLKSNKALHLPEFYCVIFLFACLFTLPLSKHVIVGA